MTVDELREQLDDYGGHMDVYLDIRTGEKDLLIPVNDDMVETATQPDGSIAVLLVAYVPEGQ